MFHVRYSVFTSIEIKIFFASIICTVEFVLNVHELFFSQPVILRRKCCYLQALSSLHENTCKTTVRSCCKEGINTSFLKKIFAEVSCFKVISENLA